MKRTTQRDGDLIFHRGLLCYVERLEYDFKSQIGILYMPHTSFSDMSGCINLFKSIDPKVKHIKTISGDRPDTEYLRTKETGWEAMPPQVQK